MPEPWLSADDIAAHRIGRLWKLQADIAAVIIPEGFNEPEVRAISENPRVLEFVPSSGFEQN